MSINKHPIQFISLGAGNPDDVTTGTLRRIKEADVIYCFGSHGVSHAAEIINLSFKGEKSLNVIDIPMSKDRVAVNAIYRNLADTIAKEHATGKKIAVATEGDTGIFATTHYVMDMLTAQGIPCRQFAGIPSFIAAGALANLHLVSLNQRLLIIPGDTTAKEMERLIGDRTNLVIMKLSMATEAVHKCMDTHPEFQYHYFRNIGMSDQEYNNDIEILRGMTFPYFSLMIIQK